MIVTRSLRHVGAWTALAALLFAQVCLAVYACPLAAPVQPTAAAMPPGCDGEGPPHPDAACENHCQGTSALVSAAQTSTVAILDTAPLLISAWDSTVATGRSTAGGDVPVHANAPPAAIRFCRFLI